MQPKFLTHREHATALITENVAKVILEIQAERNFVNLQGVNGILLSFRQLNENYGTIIERDLRTNST